MKQLVLILFLLPVFSYSQEKNKKNYSIIANAGLGLFEGKEEFGLGYNFSVGLQMKVIEQSKTSYIIQFSYGKYNSNSVRDIPNQYFNSYSLNFRIDHDLITFKPFSLFGTIGVSAKLNKGKISSFYNFETQTIYPENNFSHFYSMAYLGLGIQFAPKSKNFAIKLEPIQFYFSPNSYQGNIGLGMTLNLN